MNTVDVSYLVSRLQALIQIPSPPGREGEVASYVDSELRSLGLNPFIDEYFNVVATLGEGPPRIMINAHLDTVPPGEGWTVDPYGGELRDGKVYGRGASDNKAGVAAMLAVARALKDAELRGTLVLLFTSREEGRGKLEARKGLKRRLEVDAAICLDFFIDAESRSCPVAIGCRGVANIEVDVEGKAWHSSEPEQGVNAIYRALELVEALRRPRILRSSESPLPVREDLAVTMIEGGEWPTMIPDRCKLMVNFRLLPHLDLKNGVKRVERVAARVLKGGFKARLKAGLKGYLVDPSASIVEAVKKAAVEEGLKPELTIARGWLDAAQLSRLFRAPVVCVGTMTKGQAHVKDEYVKVDDVVAGANVSLRALRMLLA